MGQLLTRNSVTAGVLALGLSCVGCQHARDVQRELDGVESLLQNARRAGAYACAPRELALSRAHLDFARIDLAQGDSAGADEHLREASLNARGAKRLSPAERCAAPPAMPKPPSAAQEYRDQDSDQDGVADSFDRCPNQSKGPGTIGADGCLEVDPDGDRVMGSLDRCPLARGAPSNEGCPRLKYRNLEVTASALRLTDPVLFDADTAVIRSVSFRVLDTVVEALREHPEINLELAAHTDSQGEDLDNRVLSQGRADAVRSYLLGHGIEPSRLTARGYGETRPIESNRTSQGRDINRRVEFIRTDTAQ